MILFTILPFFYIVFPNTLYAVEVDKPVLMLMIAQSITSLLPYVSYNRIKWSRVKPLQAFHSLSEHITQVNA